MSNEQVLHEKQVTHKGDTLRIIRQFWKDRYNISIRKWYKSSDGNLLPGKEGLNLTEEDFLAGAVALLKFRKEQQK